MELQAAAGIACEGGHAVKGLTKRLFQIPEEQAQALPRGQGGIVTLNGEKMGVYKDGDGRLFPVSIRCSHLGCQLEWNPDELTWDCPCHGSRFDRYGNLISGPAQTGLEKA
jgi:Rieske Fe-S protein